MGRRPNPIILEHFTRGDKLKNTSNRYEHTCNYCGTHIENGRHEHLTHHMIDVCPGLSEEKRARILLKLHGLEHAAQPASQNNTGPSRDFDLPFSPSRPQNFDGLNVLAEASRRVGIQAPKKKEHSTGSYPPLDPALGQDLPDEFVNSDDAFEGYVSAATGLPATSGPAYPPLFSFMPAHLANGSHGPARLPGLGVSIGEPPVAIQPDLSSMAASANETLTHSLLPNMFNATPAQAPDTSFTTGSGMNGDLAGGEGHQTDFSWTSRGQPPSEQEDESMTQEVQEAAAFPRPIAINPDQNKSTVFVEETGTAAKSQKAKQRSAFNPQRKKEVQEVRLRGVCIRCKMLKKPCGLGTPCKPCSDIDNTRLWGSCSRWDLKKDLDFYTLPLHSTIAFSDITKIKNQIGFQPFEGHILVSLIDGNPAKMEVPSEQGQQGSHASHPQYGITMQRQHFHKSEEIFIFSINKKELAPKLQQYLEATFEDFISREDSPLICATLMTAHKMVKDKGHKLLKLVLDLWVLTHILTSPIVKMVFEAVPKNISTTASPPQARQYITEDVNMYSHSLLCSQLRAAVAERAAEVKRTTMAAFEAQFMKGPTTTSAKEERFETFLASIILVNAAERYKWLFNALANDKAWPLDVSPLKLAKQADKVAAHLEFMLRVRRVAPDKQFGEDRVLNFCDRIDENENAYTWFRTIGLTRDNVSALKNATFDSNNPASLDGHLFCEILHSSKPPT